MVQFNGNRETAIFYTSGICNLNCRYCCIDKNPVLKQIDDELEESFKGDYYFNRVKEYFPRRDLLKRIETWGGEPFLHMDRIYPLIHQLIDYYPYFREFYSSTNFAFDDWFDKFLGIIDIFSQYPYRRFLFDLQLSVDGPAYINDANRGTGVTERCIANFNKLIQYIKDGKFPSNIDVHFILKGTWDIDCMHKLNNKEKLIEFFQFYEENYIDKVAQLNNEHFIMAPTVPNMAVPAPVTKADGIMFKELVTKCQEIEEENRYKHYFKYYNRITPFVDARCPAEKRGCNTYHCRSGSCGTGDSMVGFLPNNIISLCHEGFTELISKYKSYKAQRHDEDFTIQLGRFVDEHQLPMCTTDEKYTEHERKMGYYFNNNSTARLVNTVDLIIALAMAKQIDQKYIYEKEALRAAYYVLYNCAYCVKNNYNITGSFLLESADFYKLFLNGALDIMTKGGAWFDGNENN